MNRLLNIAALLIIAFSLARGNVKQNPFAKLVGTWESSNEVNGEPQAVIKIKRADSKLDGTLIFRGLTVNGQENVTLELPLNDSSINGDVFSFKITFPGPEKKITDWEFKLRDDNEAGFSLVSEDGKHIDDGPSFSMKRVKSNRSE